MKVYMHISLSTLIATITVLLIGTSCDNEKEELESMRRFTPVNVQATNGPTSVRLTWNPSLYSAGQVVEYQVEVSKTLTFDEIEFSTTTTETKIDLTEEDIEIQQDHFARIKALGEEEELNSRWGISTAFQILGEQIMFPVSDADKGSTSVILKWPAGSEVTHIKLILLNGGSSQNYTITPGEKAAGSKTITALTPGTSYTAEIYNTDAKRRGFVSFETYVDVPDADRIIFLSADDVFTQSSFDTLTASSVTFVLPQGAVFSSTSSLTFKGSTDITLFGMPGVNRPIVSLGSSQYILPVTGGKIRFENIEFSGYEYVDGVQTTDKRNYIFNQSTASVTSEVTFENCIIRNYVNTPFRLQGANIITIGKLTFNNCIAFDTGNNGTNGTYAFISTNTATGKIDNIEITNSTIYNIGYGLILHNAAASQSVKIENCTFSDVIGDGRYFIDYNAQSAGTFTLANCIFGKSKSQANTARGIRISGTGVSAPTCYKTSDFSITNTPINNLVDYTGASTDLFVDPTAGNFNFKDTNFEGKNTTGDPRWRP